MRKWLFFRAKLMRKERKILRFVPQKLRKSFANGNPNREISWSRYDEMSSFLKISFFLEDPEHWSGPGRVRRREWRRKGGGRQPSPQCWTDAMAAGAYQTQVSIFNIFKFLEFRNSSCSGYYWKIEKAHWYNSFKVCLVKIDVNWR